MLGGRHTVIDEMLPTVTLGVTDWIVNVNTIFSVEKELSIGKVMFFVVSPATKVMVCVPVS